MGLSVLRRFTPPLDLFERKSASMNTSESIDQLCKALAAAQSEFINPEKNKTAKIRTKDGGSYSYNYADLPSMIESSRKALAKAGLSHCSTMVDSPDALYVTMRLMHESGQWIESHIPVRSWSDEKNLAAQVTYYRRYLYQSLIGVAADEDLDGTPDIEGATYTDRRKQFNTSPTQTPKSTALAKPVATQGAPDTSPALKTLIERASKGGPDAIAEATKPAVELKWDGPLPSCMAAKVPFGKQKGTPLVDISIPEALAMADWIKAQAAKGKVPPAWVEFYFSIMDYEQSSQPLQEVPRFGDEQQTSLAGGL